MTDSPKNCPHCGEYAVTEANQAGGHHTFRIRCVRYCVSTAVQDSADWNGSPTRAQRAAVAEWNSTEARR